MAGCAIFGYSLAAASRREMRQLRQLLGAVQEMEWELKYRLTELPELCRIAADAAGGKLRLLFRELADRLDRREVTQVTASFNALLSRQDFPRRVRKNLCQLGRSLGRFDLEGQLQGLEAVRYQCRKDLKELEAGSVQRQRSYQTLALCAGASLIILLL